LVQTMAKLFEYLIASQVQISFRSPRSQPSLLYRFCLF
jgi:hypothetical protein